MAIRVNAARAEASREMAARVRAAREEAALEMASNEIKARAVGVDMGRNIFQSETSIGMIKAVRAVVHDGKSVDDALKIYKE